MMQIQILISLLVLLGSAMVTARNTIQREKRNAISLTLEASRQQLENLSGVTVIIATFTNWALTINIEHLLKVEPLTVAEIQQVVTAASIMNLKIRCAGAGHSWAPLFPDENQVLMDLSLLTITPRMTFNPTEMLVTAIAGVDNGEALEFYLQNSIAPLAAPVSPSVTLVGQAATATHGGDNRRAAVTADYFTEVKFVDGYGNLRVVTDVNELKSVAAGLGLFGIIYEVTFRVQATETVSVINTYEQIATFNDPLAVQSMVNDHDQIFIFWLPYNSAKVEHLLQYSAPTPWDPKQDEIIMTTINTPASTTPLVIPQICLAIAAGSIPYLSELTVMGRSATLLTDPHSMAVANKLGHEALRPFNRLPGASINMESSSAHHLVDGTDSPNGSTVAVEWSWKMDPNLVKAGDIIDAFCDHMKIFADRHEYPIRSIAVRFQKSSRTYAAQSYDTQDHVWMTVDIGGVTGSIQLFTVFVDQLWAHFVTTPHLDPPRVHLGKYWSIIAQGPGYTRTTMGWQLDQIKQMRSQLNVDPNNTFTNHDLMLLLQL